MARILDLQIVAFGTFFCFLSGATLGLMAGFFGKMADTLIGRLIDVVIAFPAIVVIIALISVLGVSLVNLYIGITITGWTAYARLVRGETLAAKSLPYVQSARSLGYSQARILFRHIMPNVISPGLIFLVTDMVGTILLVTSLKLSRSRPAAANARVGRDDRRGPALHAAGVVDGAVPRAGDRAHGGRAGSPGGWAGGRAAARAGLGARMPLLEVEDLAVEFVLPRRRYTVLDGVSMAVDPGRHAGDRGRERQRQEHAAAHDHAGTPAGRRYKVGPDQLRRAGPDPPEPGGAGTYPGPRDRDDPSRTR